MPMSTAHTTYVKNLQFTPRKPSPRPLGESSWPAYSMLTS